MTALSMWYYLTFDFDSRYYGIDSLLAGSDVNPSAFKDLFPIHVFDVSKQSERLTEGVVGITVTNGIQCGCTSQYASLRFGHL